MKFVNANRSQEVMHDGMPYDLIEGQGHGGPKVAKLVNFKVHHACGQRLMVNYDNPSHYLNFMWTDLGYYSSFGIT